MGRDSLIDKIKEILRQAYRQGYNDGIVDFLTDGEKPHFDCLTEGFQNFWENINDSSCSLR